MAYESIMAEVVRLHEVSERLTLIADEHPAATEGLLAISISVTSAANILALLVETKLVVGEGGNVGEDGHKPIN